MRTTRMLRTRRFRSHAGKPGRYPLAIVAAYGPDTQLATKLVVSVFERPAQPDAAAMRTWHTDGVDARHDSVIAGEISDFLAAHGVKQTVMPDELIGCPHQEGLDYPMGRVCPRCPAWAGLDRFTHQPLAMPVATLTVPEVLDALTSADAPLPKALTSADAQRDALVNRSWRHSTAASRTRLAPRPMTRGSSPVPSISSPSGASLGPSRMSCAG